MNPEELAVQQAQQQFDADPALQAFFHRHKGASLINPTTLIEGARIAQQHGFRLPDGYTIDYHTGRIVKGWGPWDYIWRGALTLGPPLAVGLLGPEAAAAGGGSTAGVGTELGDIGASTALGTAAKTGLGSLFGGGLGVALKKLLPLASAIPAGIRAFQGPPGGPGGLGELPPEARELFSLAIDRLRQQQPLYTAALQQAQAGLPRPGGL